MEGGTQEGGLVATEMEEPDWSILLEIFLSPLSSQLSCSLQAIKCSVSVCVCVCVCVSCAPPPISSLFLWLSSLHRVFGVCFEWPLPCFYPYILAMLWFAEETLELKRRGILWPDVLCLGLRRPKNNFRLSQTCVGENCPASWFLKLCSWDLWRFE